MHAMVLKFQEILESIVSSCFSWKRVRRKSNDSPWLTDGLRVQIKKRLAIFKSEGRSIRWKRLDICIKNTIETRKGAYFQKETDMLREAGRQASWYSILTKVMDNEAPKLWLIADLEPDKAPITLAEDLAAHFTYITNQATALKDSNIPGSIVPDVLLPQLTEDGVAKRLKEYKKAY